MPFSGVSSISAPWYLVACKPRTEQRIAASLAAIDSACYLPLVTHRDARRHQVISPLFPRYLFAVDPEAARRTRLTIAVVPIVDQHRIRRELASVEKLLSSGLPIFREFVAGESVRVAAGPLMGMLAIVDRLGSHGRVHVTCHALGTVVAAEVPADHLERTEVAA